MPALPQIYRRLQAAAEDTRIIDARQLEEATARAARSVLDVLENGAKQLSKRVPTIAARHSDTANLARRQDENVCNAGYISGCYEGLNSGPAPGAAVGIVLGAVAGFLLLLWLLFVLSSGGNFIRTSNIHEEDVVVNHHGHRRSHSPRTNRERSTHRASYRSEMRQTNTSPAPARRDRDRVVRQERIVREVPREQSRVRDPYIVEETRTERRVDGDDVIEVIEGSDMTSVADAPRRKGRRSSAGYRSVQARSPSRSPSPPSPDRIASGYRRVDPNRFGGGDHRQHSVR